MRKGLTLLLTVVLALTMFPLPGYAAGSVEFSDLPDNWSKTALQNAVSNGLLQGYDGEIRPGDSLTRAQMAAVMNRAFGASEKASLDNFQDVPRSAWYYDDMSKAVQMGIFTGTAAGLLQPEKKITREETFLVLSRALRVQEDTTDSLNVFSDQNRISSWAKDGVSALVAAGYVSGSAGKLNPKANITRAEFAQLMDNLIKQYITSSGTYTEVTSGSIMINVPGVTLKDVEVKGDLIIGDGVGDGNVTLDHVTVAGHMIVRGGGENSIIIKGNSSIKSITVVRIDGKVRVFAEDGTEIGETIVDGKDDVILEGSFDSVMILADHITVTALDAAIDQAQIDGDYSILLVKKESSVDEVSVKGDHAAVKGEGTVDEVFVHSSHVSVETDNTAVTASEDSTDVKAGKKAVSPGSTVVTTTTPKSGSSSSGSNGGTVSTAEAPSANPPAGAVTSGTAITLTTSTSEATIYYTIDGSTPSTSSTIYTAPIVLTEDTTIKAMAVKSGMNNSSILSASYTVTVPYTGPFEGGSGTAEDPYQVSTAEQLDLVRDYLDAYFIQINDIDLTAFLASDGAGYNSGEGWIPIGTGTNPFTGSYDGDDYTISGLTINRPTQNLQGLFGYVNGAELTDIHLVSPTVTGDEKVGALAGVSSSVITGCSVSSAAVFCEDMYAGGLAGVNYGTITDCYTTGTVKCDYEYAGGLVGENSRGSADPDHAGTIQNCYSEAQVTYFNSDEQELEAAGGLIGYNSVGVIENCHASGSVTAHESVGGLIGESWKGSVTDCYATGDVSGISDYDGDEGYYTGGLIGESTNENTVENCWASGDVTAQNDAGGLVGYNGGLSVIENCYVDSGSTVSGPGANGGLVGYNSGIISKSYSNNTVNGGEYLGGLCGYSSGGTIEYCYSGSTVTSTGGPSLYTAGGLCGGVQSTTVDDCYATGDVTSYREVGGLIGYLSVSASVQNCYATGKVTGTVSVGGLIGAATTSSPVPTVSSCYYDQETTEKSDNDGRGTPLSTAQMTTQSNFTGWDFTESTGVWAMEASPASYPYLQWQSDDLPYPPSGFAGGSGTVGDPYEVETAAQLNHVRDRLDAYFIQTANINLTVYLASDGAGYNAGACWEPIGTSVTPFTGSYDGNGYTISNLTINRSGENNIGLFGYTSDTANLEDIDLDSINVSGSSNIGGLAGFNEGDITDCTVSGLLTSVNSNAGLLAGKNQGAVTDCQTSGTVTGGANSYYAAGLIGYNEDGTISDCSFSGAASGMRYIGGLVGGNTSDGTISSCAASGTAAGINSEVDAYVGGLAGYNEGTIEYSYASSTVSSNSNYLGGLVSQNYGTINECYSQGSVSSNEAVAGGLVAQNFDTILNSYSTSSVHGELTVGGLAGYTGAGATITNCYATGAVSYTQNTNIGGLVGLNSGGGSTITSSYYNTDTTGQSDTGKGTGLNASEMTAQSSFSGWDFDNLWQIDSDPVSYPYLQWQGDENIPVPTPG